MDGHHEKPEEVISLDAYRESRPVDSEEDPEVEFFLEAVEKYLRAQITPGERAAFLLEMGPLPPDWFTDHEKLGWQILRSLAKRN